MSGLKVSNGILLGWSARNFENELSVMRPPFVSSSFSVTQYCTLAGGTENMSATSLTLYPPRLSAVYPRSRSFFRTAATVRPSRSAISAIEALLSMEIVEINPVIDEHNRTALLGVELVLSGLGQKIL